MSSKFSLPPRNGAWQMPANVTYRMAYPDHPDHGSQYTITTPDEREQGQMFAVLVRERKPRGVATMIYVQGQPAVGNEPTYALSAQSARAAGVLKSKPNNSLFPGFALPWDTPSPPSPENSQLNSRIDQYLIWKPKNVESSIIMPGMTQPAKYAELLNGVLIVEFGRREYYRFDPRTNSGSRITPHEAQTLIRKDDQQRQGRTTSPSPISVLHQQVVSPSQSPEVASKLPEVKDNPYEMGFTRTELLNSSGSILQTLPSLSINLLSFMGLKGITYFSRRHP